MATTTPNFGWPVPTSTDLVKDGATAMEALGDAIDTSMVDLKGGTTGQVLSKASSADMDFVWVTNADGDITGVTAGTGLTGGGTSGTVSLAFDVANYGGGQYAAGKNKIINGDFSVWQRGTSLATYGYLADRFLGDSDASLTQSRQTFTPGTAPVAGYEGAYFYRLAKSAGGSYVSLQQRIEDVRTFAGQTITLSFWAKIGSGTQSVGTAFEQNFGSGGSSGVYTYGSNVTLTTSWTRYSVTVTLPSIAGKTIGTSSFLNIFSLNLSSSAAITFDYWGVQVEAGSTATPFQTATGTIQGELAACQRYYIRWTCESGAPYAMFAPSGKTDSTTQAICFTTFPVQLRSYPVSIEWGGTLVVDATGSSQTVTGVALQDRTNTKVLSATYTVASGLTAAQYANVRANNSATAYLGVSAEL